MYYNTFSMILWIASYPKSGNTWIRALVSTYMYSDERKFNFDLLDRIPKFVQDKYFSPFIKLEELKKKPLKIVEYWHAAQSRINLANRAMFFKTHNACAAYGDKWFTDETNTIGYIYVVRDPRAVVCSLAHHSSISLEKATAEVLNEKFIGYNGSYKLAELPGSWKINYLSWKKKKNFEGIIIKYEDLIDNAEREFKKILFYLKKIFKTFGYDESYFLNGENKILEIINSCQFSNLRKMEEAYGFKEAIYNKFFRIGQKDNWKKELSSDLRRKIEVNFKKEMLELGYL